MLNARTQGAVAEFFNESGQLFSPALTSYWQRPDRVDLNAGKLTIFSTRTFQKSRKSERMSPPSQGLLESFISIEGSGPGPKTLRSAMEGRFGEDPSDQKIIRFVKRYGGLQAFYRLETGSDWPRTAHTEYCSVWRYFAGAMRSLLQIAAEQYQGKPGSPEQWEWISAYPAVMRKLVRKQNRYPLEPLPLSDEEHWLALAHFAGKESQRTPMMLASLLNTLLGLGRVRPWLSWSTEQGRGTPIQLTYSSDSFLSYLALQLCLRIAKVDAFAPCFHCGRTYLPEGRAPKAGQRNFCPECRSKDMPNYYSHRDYRRRKRIARESGEDT